MKLGEDSSLEILRTSKDNLIHKLKEKSPTWEDSDDIEINQLLDVYEKNKYVFSNSVIDTLYTIKVNDEFDCNILKERKTLNGIIILDSTELYIFQEIGEKLKVMNFKVSIKDDYSDIKIFTFNLNENEKIIAENIETEVWKKFLRCLIYLDFLPTETKYINPNEKFGTRKQGKVINKTDHKIILVTKAWNQEYKTKPNTKFYSKAHWGIRWTGSGRTTPKITFIKGSLKGLNKPAEKEIKR
ncbi:hypothetical protein SAMN05444411_1324 [Lutibacter oricola]|uniref:Uncharacterized protein n=1 Tax=Lutibacter oricola TaxID=762486 RepID=A0A1H3HB81_9FLAO|nr:hypothetical protein [Lutibacter oricola]SDY12732.1 hypothetical protein SAMN05444411_1324 [Lutibacter oricola]